MKTMKATLKILLCLLCLHPLSIKAENVPYQLSVIQKIVSNLYETNHNFTHKKPTIEFKNTTLQVASFVPDKNVIVVEAQAYQICQSMGKDSLNALAFLLGHELTHFYQHAHTKVGFISNFLSYDKTPKADTRLEKEADVQGAFNAYLAGYDIGDNIGLVLDKIYTGYQLKGKILTGYPAFEERQKVATQVQDKVNDLIKVYESASYLAALGQYDFARKCYEHILEVYQNRELYNNLGILSALSANEIAVKDEDNLIFPYTLDWTTRLSRKKSRGTELPTDYSTVQQRTAFLKQAQSHFDKATRMDKDYLVAPLNKLCILAQLGKTEEALQAYNKLKKRLKNPEQRANMKLVYALILSKKLEKLEESKTILEELSQNSFKNVATMAQYNKEILDGKTAILTSENCDFTVENTQFDSVQLHKLSPKGYCINVSGAARLIFQKQANSTVIQAKINGKYYFAFQRIKGFLPENAQKILASDSVTTEGGGNDKIVTTTNGFISLCEEQQVAFRYDNAHKMVEWVRFYGN
jgi:tetratricopeptide (TPR) repeat protein